MSVDVEAAHVLLEQCANATLDGHHLTAQWYAQQWADLHDSREDAS